MPMLALVLVLTVFMWTDSPDCAPYPGYQPFSLGLSWSNDCDIGILSTQSKLGRLQLSDTAGIDG